MKFVLGALALLIVLFFAVPMISGGSTNACQALEKHNVSNTASSVAGGTSGPVYGVINGVGQSMATGNATTAAEQNAHPDTPSPISCTVDYWKSI